MLFGLFSIFVVGGREGKSLRNLIVSFLTITSSWQMASSSRQRWQFWSQPFVTP